MRTIMKMGFAAALLLGTAQVAMAGEITETQSVPATGTKWSQDLDFSGFNTSLGTLTGVTLVVTETLNGTGSAVNDSGQALSGTIVLTDTATLTLPDTTYFNVINQQNSATINLSATSPGNSVSGVPIIGASSPYDYNATEAELSIFDSGWVLGASDSSLFGANFGNANGVTVGATDTGALTVEAEYFYNTPQIPEPLGIAVMASGLLGLGFLRFRRS